TRQELPEKLTSKAHNSRMLLDLNGSVGEVLSGVPSFCFFLSGLPGFDFRAPWKETQHSPFRSDAHKLLPRGWCGRIRSCKNTFFKSKE
ncbi:hypothetical protein M404DRAFT_1005567, partial [Pisolithus tinctorius Marx 270]